MPCGRLGLMLPRVRHTSHQIQTYVSYFHQILIAWRKGDFSSRFTSLESCGREEKLGKLTENISTITVTTFAMVSLSTTSVDDMLQKFQGIKQLYCYCYCYCNNCRHLQTKKMKIYFHCLVSRVELHFRSSWQFAMHPSPSSIKTLNAEMLLLRINIIANGTLSFCISFYFHLHLLLGESFTFTHTTHQEPGGG